MYDIVSKDEALNPDAWLVDLNFSKVARAAVTVVHFLLRFSHHELPFDVMASKETTELRHVAEKIITELNQKCIDDDLFENTLKCSHLDQLITTDVVCLLSISLSKTEQSWSQVLILLNIFRRILIELHCKHPNEYDKQLENMRKHLQSAVKEHVAEWIVQQGGWARFEELKEETITMLPAIDHLLRKCEHFLVFFHGGKKDKRVENLISMIASNFKETEKKPITFTCGYSSFKTQNDEVKFFASYNHAIFVVFVTPDNVRNQQLQPCFQLISSLRVVIVKTFGVQTRELPSCMKQCKTQETLEKSSWTEPEVKTFVVILKSHFKNIVWKEMLATLGPKNDQQFTLQLKINLHSTQPLDQQLSQISTIREHVKAQLEDPCMTIRMHLLHMYKIKNICVHTEKDSSILQLVIILGKWEHVETILKHYQNGMLQNLFVNYVKLSDVGDHCSLSVSLNKDMLLQLKETLQRTSIKLTSELSRKAEIVAAAVKKQLESSGFWPYDLYVLLLKPKAEMDLSLVIDPRGFNLLHMIIEAFKPQYFEVVFFLGVWSDLRLQLTESKDDSQYADFTPRGLAEKFLPKTEGPTILEEYDNFDSLWNTIPLIHKACLHGRLSYVEMLLTDIEDINAKDQTGSTCILYACAQGSVDILAYVYELGADPMMENKHGQNGFIMAAKFGKSDVIKWLLSKCNFDPHHRDHYGNRALDYVAMNGDLKTLAVFVKANLSPDQRMVAFASQNGRCEMVRHLVSDCGIGCTGRDNIGRTPLLNAVANNDIPLVRFLLHKKQASLSDYDNEHRNCLHLVAEFNCLDACLELIQVAKDQDCLKEIINDCQYYTDRDQLKVVRGRDHGRKAWHIVLIKRTLYFRYEEMKSSCQIDVKCLGEIQCSGFGLKPDKSLMKKQDEKSVEIRAKRFADMTPLMVAAWKNHSNLAKMLLEAGADPNIVDHFGSTPLHMAAMWGNLRLACQLEEHGVNAEIKNGDGQTAADVAALNGNQMIVDFLEGKKFFKNAEKFLQVIDEVKCKLSDEELNNLRAHGQDIRRYLITIARDLKIDINKALLELGSGPVKEESLNTQYLKPAQFKCEFAGQ